MAEKLNRKEIKRNAKKYLKRNYWIAVFVTFITVTVLGGGYFYTKNSFTDNLTENEIVAQKDNQFYQASKESDSDVVNDFLNIIFKDYKEGENDNTKIKKQIGRGILSGVIDKFNNKRVTVGIINSITILLSGDKFHNFALSMICTILSLLLFFLVKDEAANIPLSIK